MNHHVSALLPNSLASYFGVLKVIVCVPYVFSKINILSSFAVKAKVCLNHMVIFMAENVSKVVADVFIREKIMQALWYL